MAIAARLLLVNGRVLGGTAFTVTELFTRARWDAPLTWTGQVPVRCRPPSLPAAPDGQATASASSSSSNWVRWSWA